MLVSEDASDIIYSTYPFRAQIIVISKCNAIRSSFLKEDSAHGSNVPFASYPSPRITKRYVSRAAGNYANRRNEIRDIRRERVSSWTLHAPTIC